MIHCFEHIQTNSLVMLGPTYNILECELNCISNIGPTGHDTANLLYLDNKYCKITSLLL